MPVIASRHVVVADACPSCGSRLLQPLRWAPDGTVELRCAECDSCFRLACTPAEARRIDARHTAARQAILAACEQVAEESLEALAGHFATRGS